MSDPALDLLVVGAGPTGIAVGAAAVRRGLKTLLVDQGPLCASLQAYPTDLVFFTTRERLEIADVPFTIPDVKPNRRQALVYYREVVKRHGVPLALYEPVERVETLAEPDGDGARFVVHTRPDSGGADGERTHRARAVALATGYFWNPKRLGVDGEDLPWVHSRYVEPFPHFGQRVVIVGGGNSAAKTALDLWRNDARVTLVHRRAELKPSVKYWIRPDIDNRIAEGSIDARFDSRVTAFRDGDGESPRGVEIEGPTGSTGSPGSTGRTFIPADAVYVLIGYLPDVDLQRRAGVEVDPESFIPAFDPETCESNVPGLYIAGTLQAGRFTNRLFIENSRDHGKRIVGHLAAHLEAAGATV
ncbi:MAG: NAD(P)-binding domain-containing protein [Acidobacteriota bacterium]|jgi:thioredoxin reductase (NADPH)